MLFSPLMFIILILLLPADLYYYGFKRRDMFNVIFVMLLLFQGGLHFMGLYRITYAKKVKGVNPDKPITAWYSALLILAGFLFFTAAILFVETNMLWLVVSTCTVIFSQCLIIMNWRKMWYGTLLNIFISIGIVFSYSSWKLEKMIDEKINFMYAYRVKPQYNVTGLMINAQPPIVRKWLFRSNILDKKAAECISLKQAGEMKTSPSGQWMKVKAKEYFTTTNPAFLWAAEVDGGTFMKLRGIDYYRNGKGHMQIQCFSLFPVVNSSGKEIDQGCLLRYMAEMVWFPSAALKPYLHWAQLDSTHAKATMNYGSVNASGIFTFNAQGDVVCFEAKRYYNRPEGATLEDWLISIDEDSYKDFGGIRVPTKASLSWKLKSGTFNWFNLEVSGINYK